MKKVTGYLSAAFLLALLAPPSRSDAAAPARAGSAAKAQQEETAPAQFAAATEQEDDPQAATPRLVEVTVQSVEPFLTRPLREIPPNTEEVSPRGDKYLIPNEPNPFPPLVATEPDTARQTTYGPGLAAPTPTGVTFDGVGVGLSSFVPSSNPPDTNGRVGATQYVQWNNTSFAVFSKTGTLLYGPAKGNTLWTGFGGNCETHNDGDPVANYDLLSGRWILGQFVVGGSPNYSHECVAVSQTSDATGAWYLYDFVTDATNFVDYTKIGVWPDGYYMTGHVFNAAGTTYVGPEIYVFERTQMIQGLTARMVKTSLGTNQFGMVPGDLDSTIPPPVGAAEFVAGPHPTLATRFDAWRVAVTWGATPAITLTGPTAVTVTSAGTAPCASNTAGQNHRDCVPQPSPAVATDDLDNLSGHFMYRLAYRNFGGAPVQESLVATETAAGASANDALRWYELRNAGGLATIPTVFQQSTFDPNASWRWMGSIAMDNSHDIALGYSKSDGISVLPEIDITGRLGTDTVNTMGPEATVQAGAGVQFSTAGTGTAGNRWGDYSAMTLDPIDQCTFWYTNEYLKTNGSFNWSTRIASYKFAACTAAAAWGTISGNVTSCATGAPISGVVVNLSNGFAGATNAAGNYSILVPAGTYTATATDANRNCTSSTPASPSVTVGSGGTATQNFCMTGTSNLQFNAVAIDDSTTGNNNGIINANECVNLNVTVKNNGCNNETAISSTLTTGTANVSIIQGSSAYPNLAIDASGVNATPFKIQTSNTFVCGTPIAFTLNLTYASGSKAIGFSVPTCAGGANQTIPTSSITLADLTQTDRMGRDGNPSPCSPQKTCPAGIGTAGTRNYKTFTFNNTAAAPACITVDLQTTGCANGGAGDIESVAYLTTYNPAALCTNYLGDSGVSGIGNGVTDAPYSFTVPASSAFVVVVNTTTGSTTCANFSGIVSGFYNLTPGPGACSLCTPPAVPGGVTATASAPNQITVSWGAVGGATSYNVYRSNGACPGGAFAQIATGVVGTSYVDNTVTGGLSYSYKVTSFNVCESAQSTCAGAAATGNCTSFPNQPTGLAATANGTGTCGISLSWTAGSSNCGASVSYSIYRSTASGFIPSSANRIAQGVPATSWNDTAGLAAGTPYFYIVHSVDTSTGAEETNVSQATATTAAVCATATSNAQAFTVTSSGNTTGTSGQNLLEWWSPAAAVNSTVTINFRTDQFPTGPADGAATTILTGRAVSPGATDSFTHTGLTEGTTYYYALWVRN